MQSLHLLTAFLVLSVPMVAADNPFLGTWKLNVAKSKGTPGTMSKEETVVFTSEGTAVKRTVTGINADGEKIDASGTLPWDGKDHKVDGPMGPSMIAVKSVDANTVNVTVKVNGKLVSTGKVAVSKDGKTMTSAFKGEDPKGRKYDNVAVYDRQ
jgi:hypothetical protein